MMVESMTETFNLLNTNSRRMYRKQKDVNSDLSSISSSKNSFSSSITTSNDWHRLLLTRLRPSATGKYRTTRKNDNKSIIFPTTLGDESTVTLQSYSDDSYTIDNRQIIISESDASKQLDSSIRRDSHYVKNSVGNRSSEHMTSLKRRVRKQQMRHIQNQGNILQETTFQPPSSADLFLMSYPEQTALPRRYRSKKSSCVVALPPIINTKRAMPANVHGIKLNLYAY